MGRGSSSRSRGQGLVEFALVFPILMLLLVAMFDVGRLVFAYNDISNAARAAVRVAIVDQGGTRAHDTAVAQATGIALTGANVTVTYLTSDLSGACSPYKIGCVARVQAQYAWQAMTPVIGSILGPITVTSETTMPIERVFP